MDLMTGGIIVNTTQIGIPTSVPTILDKTQIGNMQLETLTTQMAHLHMMMTMMTTTMTTMTTMTMAAMKNCMKTLNHTMVCSQLQPALNSN